MKGKIAVIISALLILSIGTGIVDYSRVYRFEIPLFCVTINAPDDGGSGTYVGLGYFFDIKGNFMPEDERPGVTNYVMKVFGVTVANGVRNKS